MILNLYTLKKPTLKKEVSSVNLKTIMGEITVLDNHIPYITFINKGRIKITNKDNQEEFIETNGGLIEVLPGSRVNILAD